MPSTWDAGVPFDYVLLLHAPGTSKSMTSDVTLEPQRSRASVHVSTVRGSWLAGQGGGVASPSFTRNPQFLLRARPLVCSSPAPAAVLQSSTSSMAGAPVRVLLSQVSMDAFTPFKSEVPFPEPSTLNLHSVRRRSRPLCEEARQLPSSPSGYTCFRQTAAG